MRPSLMMRRVPSDDIECIASVSTASVSAARKTCNKKNPLCLL
jgi:hypothetical protein